LHWKKWNIFSQSPPDAPVALLVKAM
jgi:hypothetical protein